MGLSRTALWQFLGVELPPIVEPMLNTAYLREADREWRGIGRRDATSFFLSNFPGDDPVCDRAAIYGLMGLPEEKPFDLNGKRYVEIGKWAEMDFVRRLSNEGMLLTEDESSGGNQTKFMDSKVWGSGAVDSIVLPYGWTKGHVVEMKNVGAEKIAAMKDNKDDTPYSHSKYVRQIKAYIGYAHEQKFTPLVNVCTDSWAIMKEMLPGIFYCPVHRTFECTRKEIQLDSPDDGTLIYSSRDPERGKGIDTVSYYFSYDPDFLEAGRQRMAKWREDFENGALPPHIHEGKKAMWSVGYCKFCSWKRNACRPDQAAKTTRLEDSKAFEFAKEIRPYYDYQAVRANVFKRWEVLDPLLNEKTAA